jgi:hypothetical protein
MYSLSHSALALAGVGRYAESVRRFDETRAFGRKYGVVPLLARAISMSAGAHFSLGDLDTAERIQLEARELARSANFSPTIVSSNIDLLLIAARRGDPGSVGSLFDETVEASRKNPGWHGWLWELRVSQMRAELALAREEWEAALTAALEGIAQCRRRTRPKYEVLGLITCAQARVQLGQTAEAIADVNLAVVVARTVEDPALLLRALDVSIALDGSDAAAAEAKTARRQILDHLPDETSRLRFAQSDLSTRIAKL